MTILAYQLYCSRNWPLEETLTMLSGAGYTAVEGYGGVLSDPDATRAQLDAQGLSMPSAHIALDQVEGDPDGTLAMARTMGLTKVFVPHLKPDQRPTDRAGWEAFARRLNEAGKPIRDAGLGYGWHNHDFELVDLGGTTPLDLIAEAGTDLELDLGWVYRAGQNPADWIGKYADRIPALHMKDVAAPGEKSDEDGWADIGTGVQDWDAIQSAARSAGITHFVLEHDNPKDHARFASASLSTLKDW